MVIDGGDRPRSAVRCTWRRNSQREPPGFAGGRLDGLLQRRVEWKECLGGGPAHRRCCAQPVDLDLVARERVLHAQHDVYGALGTPGRGMAIQQTVLEWQL